MTVVGEGVAAERKADELVKSCDAVACIPSAYADFGGVVAFAFRKNVMPDPEVFIYSGHDTKEGYRIYEPDVTVLKRAAIWEKMPGDDDPSIIKSKHQFLAGEAVAIFSRKELAEAIDFELKYIHPLEALRLLRISKDEVREVFMGKKKVKEVLAGKMFVSKGDKKYVALAIESEKEQDEFMAEVTKHTYGMYYIVKGSDKAKALFLECYALPLVPQGTLNAIVGLDDAKSRCGFFIHKNWVWVRSSNESTLAFDDDWQKVTKKLWEENCKEAKKLTS